MLLQWYVTSSLSTMMPGWEEQRFSQSEGKVCFALHTTGHFLFEEDCGKNEVEWMRKVDWKRHREFLKINNDRTEAVLMLSSSKSFSVPKPTTISVRGCAISFSSSARNPGFYITGDLSVELHIKNVCRSAYSELRCISTVRHLLFVDKKTCVRLYPL